MSWTMVHILMEFQRPSGKRDFKVSLWWVTYVPVYNQNYIYSLSEVGEDSRDVGSPPSGRITQANN